jgi:DNA polymerase III gamma/tau subunit
MLKPTEDTPKHTYFFLCTTEPEKLVKPLRDRCTQVVVKSQEPSKLYRHIKRIANKEEIEVSGDIIEEISENCEGSPRKAVKLLEKVSELSDEKDMLKVIQGGIGEEENTEIRELCKALMGKSSWSVISGILKKLKSVEVESVRYAVLGYMNAVLLNSGKPNIALIIECFEEPFYNSKQAGLTLACYKAINL